MKYIRTIKLLLIEMLSFKKTIMMFITLIIYIMTRALLYGESMDLLYVCFAGPISLYIPDILSWIFFQVSLLSIFGLFIFNHMNIRIVYILQKINNVKIWLISMVYSITVLIIFYYLTAFILTYITRFIVYGDIIINDYSKLFGLIILNIAISFTIITINLLISLVNNNFHLNIVIIVSLIFGCIITGFKHYDISKIVPICQLILLNQNRTRIYEALIVTVIPLPIMWILISLFLKRTFFKLISREIIR